MYPRYGDVYSMLKADKSTSWVFDGSKLQSVVPEFAPTISLEDGVRRTLDAIKARGQNIADEEWSAVCDRIIGL